MSRAPLAPLKASTVHDPSLTPAIDDSGLPDLVKAGLHLMNDDLDRAHVLSQAHEGNATADYWHAIVHRREGDYSNSKYWLARVGDHPVIREVHGSTAAASVFVDRCRAVGGGVDPVAEELQWREMLSLLAYSESAE